MLLNHHTVISVPSEATGTEMNERILGLNPDNPDIEDNILPSHDNICVNRELSSEMKTDFCEIVPTHKSVCRIIRILEGST